MRKLATAQRIKNIRPIPERDRVDLGTVEGYDVVIGKGQYQENELIIFCEIDSVFPKTDDWIELEKFKYRIKTFKVNTPNGPIYGQGYCFPMSKLATIVDPELLKDLREGDEVTELIGITKYEPPDPSNNSMMIGNAAGVFPTQYISKTDEPRLQSNMKVIDEVQGKEVVIRTKYDGTSWTSLKIDNEYVVCSRNNMLKNPEESGKKSDYWDMLSKYPGIKDLLDNGFALQAEMYGEGIQKNHLKMKGKHLAAFNILDLKTRQYVDDDDFEELCIQFTIPMCSVVYKGIFNFTYEEIEKMSDELKYDCGSPAEGIVIRTVKESYSKVLKGRMSFKQVSRVFLSKGGD